MNRTEEVSVDDFTGAYKEIAEVIGIEATINLHKHFQGQQITLPKKLYTKDYIVSKVKSNEGGSNVRSVASEFGYTERRLRQIIKESKC